MKISLVIATYQRHDALCRLLTSIKNQKEKPFEVIIIDASENESTKNYIRRIDELNIIYVEVAKQERGSAQQRNHGLDLVDLSSDIVAFLDDDLILEADYFEKLIETYQKFPDAIGVGGIDLKNNMYEKKREGILYNKYNYYELNGWIAKESLRYRVRKILGLMSNLQPGLIPEFSHGRSTLPPDGKIYEVEHFTGMSMSFKRELFNWLKFSNYFEGYGLYEDFDFCVRSLQYGKLYVNTNARVWHYHEPFGRPDFYKYGKMVVRNGWYVWRVRFPNPSVKARFKWHAITLLLAVIRLTNAITGPQRKNALMDFTGRITAWFRLFYNPPSISY